MNATKQQQDFEKFWNERHLVKRNGRIEKLTGEEWVRESAPGYSSTKSISPKSKKQRLQWAVIYYWQAFYKWWWNLDTRDKISTFTLLLALVVAGWNFNQGMRHVAQEQRIQILEEKLNTFEKQESPAQNYGQVTDSSFNMDRMTVFYDVLKDYGYALPVFDQFIRDMLNMANLRKVYNTLKTDGYTVGEWEDFRYRYLEYYDGDGHGGMAKLGSAVNGSKPY